MTIVTRPTRRSSLCHPVPARRADRQGEAAPAVRSLVDRVTAFFSGIAPLATTAKEQPEIDVRNPFIPASSPVCRGADVALVYWVAFIGFAAAVVALVRQVSAGVPC